MTYSNLDKFFEPEGDFLDITVENWIDKFKANIEDLDRDDPMYHLLKKNMSGSVEVTIAPGPH